MPCEPCIARLTQLPAREEAWEANGGVDGDQAKREATLWEGPVGNGTTCRSGNWAA
jgi:hypothetical protein